MKKQVTGMKDDATHDTKWKKFQYNKINVTSSIPSMSFEFMRGIFFSFKYPYLAFIRKIEPFFIERTGLDHTLLAKEA
jgi:hypothetical protein